MLSARNYFNQLRRRETLGCSAKNSPKNGVKRLFTPQNLDAEEAVLGGILLDPLAIERIADTLVPEAFYLSAHQEIYRQALALYQAEQPTDLMMMTSALTDSGQLAQVGGTNKLAQLVDRTISAANIDRYALLLLDKHLRRQLIAQTSAITSAAYDTTLDFETVLDEAEQRIFAVAQRQRHQQEVEPVAQVLVRTFKEIETYASGLFQPGLSTGLTEVDRLTGDCSGKTLLLLAAGRAWAKPPWG